MQVRVLPRVLNMSLPKTQITNPVNLKISFFCPVCKQREETTTGKSLSVSSDMKYMGSGDYIPLIESVMLKCSGCKTAFEVEYDEYI